MGGSNLRNTWLYSKDCPPVGTVCHETPFTAPLAARHSFTSTEKPKERPGTLPDSSEMICDGNNAPSVGEYLILNFPNSSFFGCFFVFFLKV